jgi:hypothetical protein
MLLARQVSCRLFIRAMKELGRLSHLVPKRKLSVWMLFVAIIQLAMHCLQSDLILCTNLVLFMSLS